MGWPIWNRPLAEGPRPPKLVVLLEKTLPVLMLRVHLASDSAEKFVVLFKYNLL